MSKFLPYFISKKWNSFIYIILENNLEIIDTYYNEIKKFFQKHILNKREYNLMRNLLIDNYPEILSIIETTRLDFKEIFLNKLTIQSQEKIESDWFIKNFKILEYSFDLFSDDELIDVISKLLNLNVPHKPRENDDSYWINLCLLTIDWGGKSNLFSSFRDEMIKLNYYQPVSDYIKKNPNRVDKFEKWLINIFGYINPEILDDYPEKINLQEIVKSFKYLLKENYNISILIEKFYELYTDFTDDFTSILEDYFKKIDFANHNINSDFLFHVFLGTNKKYYPNWDIDFFQNIIEQYLSINENREFFNPFPSLYFSKNFNFLSENIKKDIIFLLVKYKRFNCIAYSLDINFEGFKEYLDDFLKIQIEYFAESRSLIGILRRFIIKNSFNQEIMGKIKEKLKELSPTFEKAQLINYLGDTNQAYQCLEEVINNEIVFPVKIYLYVFYKTYYLEHLVLVSFNNSLNLSEIYENTGEIDTFSEDYFIYNLDLKEARKFKFHKLYYEARLYFLQGLQLLNIENYLESEKAFVKAKNIFQNLSKSKIITEETREIVVIYFKISNFITLLIAKIERRRDSDLAHINKLLLREFDLYINDIAVKSGKINKIIDNLRNFIFDIEENRLKMINFESPTSFCPIRSNLLSKYLFNSVQELIYEWDENNIQSILFEPICVSTHWEKFSLSVKLRKMDDPHSYFLDFGGPTYIKYDPERCKPTKINEDKITFEFDIKSEPFEDLKILELIINQDDICNIPVKLQFEIFHQDSKHFITHDMKINKIIDSIDTGYVDTSEYLRTSLKKELGKIKKLPIKHF
ncbi:MAG: hypothetical protein ACFFG0_13490, partial [Candidatus Thorarchaeota archaeon]